MSVRKLGAVPSTGPFVPAGVTPQAPDQTIQATDSPRPVTASDSLSLSGASKTSYPRYASLFGSQPYVRNAADENLLKAVREVVARSAGNLDSAIAVQLQASRLEPDGIMAVQRFLEARGYPVGRTGVDGKYGPLTHQALKDFLDGSPADPAPTPSAPSPAVAEPLDAKLPEPSSASSGLPAPSAADMPQISSPDFPKEPPALPAVPAQSVAPPVLPIQTAALRESLALPPRPANAPTGSQFLEQTKGMSRAERELAILEAISSGNVPDFLRQFKTIDVSMTDSGGIVHRGQLKVLPDYLAIGSDQDFVRIPMNPLTAQRVADRLGSSLPTRKLVDEIYQQAEFRVAPRPLPAGAQMMSNDYTLRHQREVDRQTIGIPLGRLIAGNKKDVVISNRVEQHSGRVAIYGWHQPDGKPIQGLSTVHENTYADYSHGIRLIGGTMTVDGVERPLQEVLRDPVLSRLLSDEGVLRNPRYPTP